jgi:hypothetical protein
MPYRLLLTLCLTFFQLSQLWAQSTPLVVQESSQRWKPGLAISWKTTAKTVTFLLPEKTDASSIARSLAEALPNATVAVTQNRVKVSGVAYKTVLEKASFISVSAPSEDPLTALAWNDPSNTSVATPESGGSIRAHNNMPVPSEPVLQRARVLHKEVFTFPQVTLTLQMDNGTKIKAPVTFFNSEGAPINFNNPSVQNNVGAFYALKGDIVWVHLTEHTPNQPAVIDSFVRK